MLYKNRTVQKMRCNVKNKKSNKKTNDFLMICDYLEKNYREVDGNRFGYTKKYLEKKVKHDYNLIKSIHAEATEEKANDTYAMLTNFFAVFVSTVSLMISIINGIKSEMDNSYIYLYILYIIVFIIIGIVYEWSYAKNKIVSHWQKYIVEAVEDILDDMKNEKDNRKEVHLPEKLYEIKVDLPDRLYNQLDSIEKAASENPLKKIISKK